MNEEVKFLCKIQKKIRGWGSGGEGGCERISEIFVKIKKKWGGGAGVGFGGEGGCERRIEVFAKIQKKIGGGGGVGSGRVEGVGSGWM